MSDFACDIFISYARADNQTEWISTFRRELEFRLSNLLNEPLTVNEGSINDLHDAAVLVPVLSPEYVSSEQCMKEFGAFLKADTLNNGAHIEIQARIFSVVKAPLLPDEQLSAFQQIPSYDFFQVDPATGTPTPFTLDESADRYMTRLIDLSHDIKSLLKKIKTRQNGTGASPTTSGAVVYLAETTDGLKERRDQIRRELQQRGHTVLPDRPLPLMGSPETLAQTIDAYLERCDLSIHLVGNYFNPMEQLVFEQQNARAAEKHRQQATFSRLIWLPTDQINDESQRYYIDSLKDDPAGAELLEIPVEELKSFIQDKLVPKRPSPASSLSNATVYLAETTDGLKERRDQIRRELQQRGHTVLPDRPLPLMGSPETLAQTIDAYLERCDLSIHLVGNYFNPMEQLVFEQQNARAAEKHRQQATFSRLIWLPTDQINDESQRYYIDSLKDYSVGAEVLEIPVEELESFIQDNLASSRPSSTGLSSDAIVYLLCGSGDREEIELLADYLYETHGYTVDLPPFGVEQDEFITQHQEILSLCDAVLIYYGHTNPNWLQTKVRELRKTPAYGNGRRPPEPPAAAVYVSPKKDLEAKIRDSRISNVIKGCDPFSPDVLTPFLEIIDKKGPEVAPPPPPPPSKPRQRVKIFISYSHKDTEYLADNSLLGFLRGLEDEGAEFWWDKDLVGGDKWDEEIKKQIQEADIALVLVSQWFLNSKYIKDVEIGNFLDRCEKEGLVIFPVMLSACHWKGHPWLSERQFLPRAEKTIAEYAKNEGELHKLFLEIYDHLNILIARKLGKPA